MKVAADKEVAADADMKEHQTIAGRRVSALTPATSAQTRKKGMLTKLLVPINKAAALNIYYPFR